MSNALYNLRSKFQQVNEIKKLLETHHLYCQDLYIYPDNISYVISVLGDDWSQPFKAVPEGWDQDRGTEDETVFAGVCIVGLKSGEEFVIAGPAYKIEEYLEERQQKRRQGQDDGILGPMRDKFGQGQAVSLDDLGEILEKMRYVSGPMMTLNLIGIAGPKNG